MKNANSKHRYSLALLLVKNVEALNIIFSRWNFRVIVNIITCICKLPVKNLLSCRPQCQSTTIKIPVRLSCNYAGKMKRSFSPTENHQSVCDTEAKIKLNRFMWQMTERNFLLGSDMFGGLVNLSVLFCLKTIFVLFILG